MGKQEKDELWCICGKCKKRFPYSDAVVKKRKLFNKEIEEKECPYCGSKGFSPAKELYWLGQMSSHHQADGRGGRGQ